MNRRDVDTGMSMDLIALIVLCLNVHAQALRANDVILKDLPPASHVYVDGKPVFPEQGRLRLPPGAHQIQIESTRGDGIVAFRKQVQVKANEHPTIPIAPLPVRVTGGYYIDARGPTGSPGPQGPEGQPAGARIINDDKALQALLNDTLLLLLADLEGQIQRIRFYERADRPKSYWYDPKGVPGPVPPVGLPGRIGPPGVAGDILLIHGEKDHLLLDELKDNTGLTAIEQTIQMIERELHDARPVDDNPVFRQWLTPIEIFTPHLKQRLDRVYLEEKTQALASFRDGPSGEFGKPGPPGRRGRDGRTVPVAPRYVAEEQKQRLFSIFNEDNKLKERVEKLKAEVVALKDMVQDDVKY